MTGNELSQLFAEVFQKYSYPEVAPGEFSAGQFAEELNISYNRAAGIIRRAVNAKELAEVGERRLPDGHICICYRKVTPAP